MKGGADAFTVNEQVLASQPVRRRSPVRPRASLLTSARDSNMSSSEPPSVSGPRADDTAPTPDPRMDLAQDGMVYEAKVIDTRAEGAPEYKVHYQGWNKKWDEWLAPSKIVRDTPENRTAMEAANEAARAAASGAAPSGKSGGAGKSKEPPASDAAAPKPKKAKTEKPADKDKVIDKDKDGKPSKPAAGKAKSAKAPKAEKSEAVPAAPAPAPPAEEVRLDVNLSVALKRELIAGWERITRENKLVALPRDVTVADVLARFVADAKTRARNPRTGGARRGDRRRSPRVFRRRAETRVALPRGARTGGDGPRESGRDRQSSQRGVRRRTSPPPVREAPGASPAGGHGRRRGARAAGETDGVFAVVAEKRRVVLRRGVRREGRERARKRGGKERR